MKQILASLVLFCSIPTARASSALIADYQARAAKLEGEALQVVINELKSLKLDYQQSLERNALVENLERNSGCKCGKHRKDCDNAEKSAEKSDIKPQPDKSEVSESEKAEDCVCKQWTDLIDRANAAVKKIFNDETIVFPPENRRKCQERIAALTAEERERDLEYVRSEVDVFCRYCEVIGEANELEKKRSGKIHFTERDAINFLHDSENRENVMATAEQILRELKQCAGR